MRQVSKVTLSHFSCGRWQHHESDYDSDNDSESISDSFIMIHHAIISWFSSATRYMQKQGICAVTVSKKQHKVWNFKKVPSQFLVKIVQERACVVLCTDGILPYTLTFEQHAPPILLKWIYFNLVRARLSKARMLWVNFPDEKSPSACDRKIPNSQIDLSLDGSRLSQPNSLFFLLLEISLLIRVTVTATLHRRGFACWWGLEGALTSGSFQSRRGPWRSRASSNHTLGAPAGWMHEN